MYVCAYVCVHEYVCSWVCFVNAQKTTFQSQVFPSVMSVPEINRSSGLVAMPLPTGPSCQLTPDFIIIKPYIYSGQSPLRYASLCTIKSEHYKQLKHCILPIIFGQQTI